MLLLTIFFELLLTMFRALREIVILSYDVLFFFLNPFITQFDRQPTIIAKTGGIIGASLLFSLGYLFLSQVIYKAMVLALRRRFAQLQSRQWLRWWTSGFLFALLIHTSVMVFDRSLLVDRLFMSGITSWWLTIIGVGLGSIYYYIYQALISYFLPRRKTKLKKRNQWVTGGLLVSSTIATLFPLVAITVIMIELIINPLGNPQASRFFKVHAAIKNTCLLDTTRSQCPHNLTDLSYIEPEAVKDLLATNQVHYTYDPATNNYTLVVRYSPLRAVIFDQRLLATSKVDFVEVDVNILGQDEILTPPAFSGPWQFADWPYSQLGFGTF